MSELEAALHGTCSLLPPLAQGVRGGSADKEPVCNAGDLGSVPGLGKAAQMCTVHGVAKCRMQLSNSHFHFYVRDIEVLGKQARLLRFWGNRPGSWGSGETGPALGVLGKQARLSLGERVSSWPL